MARAKCALIGGTGFIGRHLLERLAGDPATSRERVRVLVHDSAPPVWLRAISQAEQVEVVEGDLLRPASLDRLLEGTQVVINLAGQVSPAVDDYQRLNLGGMVTLAQACVRHRVRRVIHASSALVYGNALDATEDAPCRPISPYATLKLAAEEILSGLLASRMPLLCLRLSNVYGPRQSKGLMPYLVSRILNRQRITIDADGAQVRDFVHVRDAAAAFVKALTAPDFRGAINIGSGQPTSIMRLVRLLEDVLELPATGQYCPEQSGGERRNTVNVSRAGEVLDWRPRIGLAEGVRQLVESLGLAPEPVGAGDGGR